MSEDTQTEAIANIFLAEAPADAPPAEEPVALEAAPEAVQEKPVEDKVAARFAALAREEKRVRMERDALKKDKAEVEAAKVKWSKIAEKPVDVIREAGLDPEEFVRRVISDGQPTVEWKLQQMQAKLEQYEQEKLEMSKKREEEEFQTNVGRAKEGFASFVEDSGDKYPHLYEFTPDQIGNVGWQVATELAEELDRPPTQAEIAQKIEDQLAAVEQVKQERRAKLLARKGVAAPAPAADPKAVAKTLTNASASEKATTGRPKTQKEIDEECLKIIQSSFR